MSINSLPPVSDETIQTMQAAADKKFAEDIQAKGDQVLAKHPMLQDHMALEEVEEAQAAPEPEEEVVQQAQPVSTKPAPQDSFKALREKAERAERERDALLAQLEAASRDKTSQVAPEENEVDLDADALVEGKHLSKVAKEIKKLKQELSQYKQQSALSATEIRLKQQYVDFDSVVCADNIAMLREQYPEIAASINANPDIYSKAVSAYTMIKKLGVAPQADTFVHDKLQAQKNLAKPRPSVSISPQQGDSALSKANAFANGLTDDLKKNLWKEMNDARK